MLPTVTHDIPSRRLTAVRSVTCARYAANSSNPDVNTLVPLAHGTCSTFTPRQRRHDTRHGAYRSHAGIRPHDRCRHWRTGCRSYRGARFPHVPHRERRHDGSTDTVNGPSAAISTCLTYICVTPNSRRSNVVRRMGLSSSRVVVVHAHETRKPLAFATASAKRDDARGPDNTLAPPKGRARPAPSPEVAVGESASVYPRTASRRAFRVVVDGRDAPVQAGPQGPYLLLERRDGRCVTRRAAAQRRTRVAR